ncbi:selenium metabolism-associated LysR family transcriptional regulator [Desulfovirgula thermocuniculi]|uniref:selenium metabolism-associated LysR family transcriptional regulator n=1 Tax=Desulfovirgula thermocuniculi TaxID=348842 RepID=UPI0004048174|nr:selenium metabolism-associated LysR family transcriptional regulator [Desulfovirgula thermocuniculi]
MNFHQLHIFKVVADKKSFSKAAQVLFISQPAISMQIKSLEEHFGTRLFERNTHQVNLTEAGRILYNYVEKILTLIDEAEQEISILTGCVRGTLSIGASFTLGEYVIPQVIGRFKTQYPLVKVFLQVTNTEQIAKRVLKGTLDLGLIESHIDNQDNQDLVVKPFLQDELIVILPIDHPLAGRKSISLDELVALPLVLREKGSGTRKVAEERLKEAGVELSALNVVMELGSTEAVKKAVEAGFGASIISTWAVQKELKLHTLKPVKIKDISLLRNFYIIFRENRAHVPVVKEFISFIQQRPFQQVEPR